ncbi:hypothetical protein BDN70DRAFT_927863 [Pholiota conissans]|uniref:Nephrocystin 3-like N-terminal domain-containing protein n=1 Tax=Pholiota conissans TaxID=109636 RepID=A0A9P5ZBC3_9AGAR|nr:hypothetical protein BDN70DRAFT_927863 [Pholiota conissans]
MIHRILSKAATRTIAPIISEGGQPNFFPDAQSPIITGGVMAAVQGNAYFQGSPTPSLSERRGMKILVDHIASGAFHDASERGDPPKCHPDTRKSIIARIMKWRIKQHDRYNSVMWLNGPAGAGKSAIMQTIAELCALEAVLGGSFFFGRTAPERNNPSRFVATLAYQLIQVFPDIQERVVDAIEADQAIFTRKLATQVQVLIVQPLNDTASPALVSNHSSRIFLIDALDECLPSTAQRDVLDAITNIIGGVKLSTPPFVFLISSRPEYEIRQAFNTKSNYYLNYAENIKLKPNYDADMDIATFLHSTFRKIKDTHPIRAHLPLEWPTEEQMQYLVYTSSSQFIYAATAAQYIDSPRHNPFIRLNTILTPATVGINKDTPFSQLDNLYQLVLKGVSELPIVLEILTFLVLRSSKNTVPTIDFVSALFGHDQPNVRLALTDMYALMNVPATNDDREDVLRIHHASMVDFLTDVSRSKEFYIDSAKGHSHLANSFLGYIMHVQDANSSGPNTFLDAMIEGFATHYPHAELTNELRHALDNFGIEIYIAKMSPLQFYNTPWNDLFSCLKQNLYTKDDVYKRILSQFDAEIRDKLLRYPDILQTCIPAAYSIYPQYFLNFTGPIFSIIMARHSDVQTVKSLDATLFQFQDHDAFQPLAEFLSDSSRAGVFFPTAANYKELAKEIVENMCPEKHDPKRSLKVHLYASGWSPPYNLPYEGNEDGIISLHDRFCKFEFFAQILAKCPNDLELAMFLRHRVLQFPQHLYKDRVDDGRENIGSIGLQYIKECGMPYSDHVHISDLAHCIICEEKKNEEKKNEEQEEQEEDFVIESEDAAGVDAMIVGN